MDNRKILAAVQANLNWFRRSGVMDPADGAWGVAERVAVTTGNSAIEQMLHSFPAWTMKKDHCIIEQRRADCNFQVAVLFLLAARATGSAEDRQTGVNLVRYLYNRSGLLIRNTDVTLSPELAAKTPEGSWQWSHIKQYPVVYFDDEAWCLLLQLVLTRLEPELAAEYRCREWALKLALPLATAMQRTFGHASPDDPKAWRDPEKGWFGNLALPHWGSLACMALAKAYSEEPKTEYAAAIERYCHYVDEEIENFTVSEICYAIFGAAFAAEHLGGDFYRPHAERLGRLLLQRRQPDTGNFPAEHSEAPVGPDKVDTIYTVNWALLALQCIGRLTGDPAYADAAGKLTELLLAIQDTSPEPEFAGCWRGMFDLTANRWGGGDCYEGGAGSIYTGWTNAPIAIALLLQLDGKSLLDL